VTKIEIISGFLGAGKTTLINRLIKEAYVGEKIVLVENEFGEIGIDGGFLKDAGIEISEINSGCICCSLVGDFSEALKKVMDTYSPTRILIEPSGVGKLSDVKKAVLDAGLHDTEINSSVAVVDVNKCKMYMKNFGEFFNDQISNAGCIVFSHTDKSTESKISEALTLVKEKNPSATIITTPINMLDVEIIVEAIEKKSTIEKHIEDLLEEEHCPICNEHHHDHECHHEHHHDHECHHEHDCHHDHSGNHHHDHHADEIFTSWGRETIKKYTRDEMEHILLSLNNTEKFGNILRAKGIVEGKNQEWIYFDYVPGEVDIRIGSPTSIGKICVIGSKIKEQAIAELFGE